MLTANPRSAEIASTFGWDTVFAVHIADLNEAIAKLAATPAQFSAVDEGDRISASGRFGAWQIAPGGSGSLVRMKIPFRETWPCCA
jgi:hypothetical protein